MGIFSSYLSSVLTIGIFAFICETVCSLSKSDSSLKKAVIFITSLCIFITVALPFFDALTGLGSSIQEIAWQTPAQSDDEFAKALASQTEIRLKENIYSTFGINTDSIRIDLSVNQSEIEISAVKAEIKKSDSNYALQIEEHLKGIFGKNTKIIVSEKNDE